LLLADKCGGSGDSRKGKEPASSGPARGAAQKLDSVSSQWFDRLTRRCTPRRSDGAQRKRAGTKRGAKGGSTRKEDQRTQPQPRGKPKPTFCARPGHLLQGLHPIGTYWATSLTNQPNREGPADDGPSVQPPAPATAPRVTHRRRRRRRRYVVDRRSGRLPVPARHAGER
jgi:hypothetical protein